MKTKFVLVDRGSEHKNTAVTVRVAEDMIACGLIKKYKPVTLAQIKRDRIHIYQEAHYFQHKAHDALHAQYHDKEFTAEVLWFSRSSGKGSVRIVETKDMLPLYACNISGKKTWFPETACVYYEPKQIIKVKCSVFAGGEVFVNGLTPGIFDADRWNSLDKSRLAFKCDKNGKAINGLFG
jgi:hypothetical protein